MVLLFVIYRGFCYVFFGFDDLALSLFFILLFVLMFVICPLFLCHWVLIVGLVLRP